MLTKEPICDVSGRSIEIGDTVVTVNGQTTGRICEVAREDDDTAFVAIRPVFDSYGKGTWYAADQVFWVARTNEADKKKKKRKKTASSGPEGDASGQINGSIGSQQGDILTARRSPARKK
ncbi:MAG: hypothetical protein AAGH99_13495 [Planctomycetota bacterium]